MNNFFKSSQSLSLKQALTLWFILLVSIPVILITTLNYYQTKQALFAAAQDELSQSATANKAFIESWFEHRFTDAQAFSADSRNTNILTELNLAFENSGLSLENFVKSYPWQQLVDNKPLELTKLPLRYDFIYDILLINAKGDILYSVLQQDDLGRNIFEAPLNRTLVASAVKNTLATGKSIFSGIERYTPSQNMLTGFITTPIHNELGDRAGVLVMQLRLDSIYKVITRKSNRNTSLVHYVVDNNGILQSPIHNNWQDVLTRKINTAQIKLWQDEHGDTATLPDDMIETAFEYKGPENNQVIGIHQLIKIANLRWILISEIASNDALANLNKLASSSLIVLFASIILSTLLALWVAHRLSKPIATIADLADDIAAGKIESTIAVTGTKEIQQLSSSFNHMVEIKRHQQATLNEANKRSQQLISTLEHQKYVLDQHCIVAITDTHGVITYVNDKFCDISFYSRDELIGKTHRIIKSDQQHAEFYQQMYQTIRSGTIWHGEFCNKTKIGSLYWVETTIAPIFNEAGEIENYIAISNNITEFKKNQRDIEQTLSLLSATINSTDNGILVTNLKGEILQTNQRFLSIWQIPDHLLALKNDDVLLQYVTNQVLDSEQFIKRVLEIYQQQASDSYDLVYLTNGTILERISIPMMLNNKPAGRVWNFRDITERIQFERQLQQSHQLTELKLSIAQQLAKHQPLKKRLQHVLTQLSHADSNVNISTAAVFHCHDDNQHTLLASVSKTLNNDKRLYQEFSHVISNSINNTHQTTEHAVITIKNETSEEYLQVILLTNKTEQQTNAIGAFLLYSQEPLSDHLDFLSFIQEISELIATAILQDNIQQLLQQAKQAAEQSNALKSEFLACMSHEIRTPMNGVLGMLNLVNQTELTADQHHKISLAITSAESLLTLLDDILDFSKVEAGKLALEYIDFNLQEMLGQVTESMAIRAQKKNIEIVLDTTRVTEPMIQADPGRIRQILTNLIGNAIKFTDQGEIVITAQLQPVSDDTLQFSCSIEDTGIGIAEDKLPKLFEAFSQIDASTTRKYGGTGLGLSICKRLCQLMQGDITVESELGKGSRFCFTVTVGRSHIEQRILPQRDLSTLDVLIVDDNSTNRKVLSEQLALWQVTVTEAESAQQALDLCNMRLTQQQPLFDIALIDMQMPDIDGETLGKQLANHPEFNRIKLIMMTSISTDKDPNYFADIGFQGYFTKPTTTSDLYNALAVVTSNNLVHNKHHIVTHEYLASFKQAQPDQTFAQLQHTNVLIVEDNHINQLVVIGMLEQFGLSADIANNGQEALDKLAASNKTYHVVLMDCQMPVMDGYQATMQIRQGKAGDKNRDIIIIAMTANAMQGDREKCIDAGMNDYITKPIEPTKLLSVLLHWVSKIEPLPLLPVKDLQTQIQQKTTQPSVEYADDVIMFHETSRWDQSQLLQRLMGNKQLLFSLINRFLAEMPAIIISLQQQKQQCDDETIIQIAHTIKGIASNLSAISLQHEAKNLEIAAKNQQRTHYQQFIDTIVYEYQKIVAIFQHVIDEYNQKQQDAKSIEKPQSITALINRLQTIKQQLAQHEYIDADEITLQLQEIMPMSVNMVYNEFIVNLNQFNFEQALEALDKLLGQLESINNNYSNDTP